MPKITKISAQLKNKNRVSIFVDGSYSFSLSVDQMLEQKLVSELEISETDIQRYIKLSGDGKLYDRALEKLSRRQHSANEIRTYLKQKGAEEELIHTIIERLTKYNYLDDRKFAESWIENRRAFKKRSNRMLKSELQQKGVAGTVIDELLSDSAEPEREALKDLILKKQRITRYKDEKKLITYLIGKGFSYAEIKSALEKL